MVFFLQKFTTLRITIKRLSEFITFEKKVISKRRKNHNSNLFILLRLLLYIDKFEMTKLKHCRTFLEDRTYIFGLKTGFWFITISYTSSKVYIFHIFNSCGAICQLEFLLVKSVILDTSKCAGWYKTIVII